MFPKEKRMFQSITFYVGEKRLAFTEKNFRLEH